MSVAGGRERMSIAGGRERGASTAPSPMERFMMGTISFFQDNLAKLAGISADEVATWSDDINADVGRVHAYRTERRAYAVGLVRRQIESQPTPPHLCSSTEKLSTTGPISRVQPAPTLKLDGRAVHRPTLSRSPPSHAPPRAPSPAARPPESAPRAPRERPLPAVRLLRERSGSLSLQPSV
eukprot:3608007-Prymnesium_polylepis.2